MCKSAYLFGSPCGAFWVVWHFLLFTPFERELWSCSPSWMLQPSVCSHLLNQLMMTDNTSHNPRHIPPPRFTLPDHLLTCLFSVKFISWNQSMTVISHIKGLIWTFPGCNLFADFSLPVWELWRETRWWWNVNLMTRFHSVTPSCDLSRETCFLVFTGPPSLTKCDLKL